MIWLVGDLTLAERRLLDILRESDNGGRFYKHEFMPDGARPLTRLGLVEVDGEDASECYVALSDGASAWLATLPEDALLRREESAPASLQPNVLVWLVTFRGTYTRSRLMGRGKRRVSAEFAVRGVDLAEAIEKAKRHHGTGYDAGLLEEWSAVPFEPQ